MIDEITVDEQGRAFVRILLTVAGCPLKTELREQATEAVRSVDGVTSVSVELGTMTDEQRDALKVQLRGDVPERVNRGTPPKSSRFPRVKVASANPLSPSTWPWPWLSSAARLVYWTPTSTATRCLTCSA